MGDFVIKTENKGDVVILKISGMLDAHTTPQMEEAFEKLIAEGNYKVVVNLAGLEYISSAGLGVFMAYVETMRENGGDIKFAEASEKIYGVFDLLGFPVLYEFYNNENDAINKFGN